MKKNKIPGKAHSLTHLEPIMNPKSMNSDEIEFAKVTYEIMQKLKELIDEFFVEDKAKGKNSALLFRVNKDRVNWYSVSDTENVPLWKEIPAPMKDRIKNNPKSGYIIFVGWQGIFNSYIISSSKDIQKN